VKIRPDGFSEGDYLTCLFDPLSREYELLLYPDLEGIQLDPFIVTEYITLLDGSTRVTHIGLLGVTWLNGRKHAHTKILLRPVQRIPNIHGFVGLSFFVDQRLTIDYWYDRNVQMMTGRTIASHIPLAS